MAKGTLVVCKKTKKKKKEKKTRQETKNKRQTDKENSCQTP